MTQIESQSSQSAFDDAPVSRRLRTAIETIMSLNADRAESEEAIDREQRTERASTERRLNDQLVRHDEAAATARQEMQQAYEDRRAALIADYDDQLQRASRDFEAELFRINERADHDEHTAKKHLEESKWTAETVYEAKAPQPGERYRKTVAGLKGRLATLKRIEAEAAECLKRRRTPRPTIPADGHSYTPAAASHPETDGSADPDAGEMSNDPQRRPDANDSVARLDALMDDVETRSRRLQRTFAARMLDGLHPLAIIILPFLGAGILLGVWTEWRFETFEHLRMLAAGAVAAAVALLALTYITARHQLQHRYVPLMMAVAEARRVREACLQQAAEQRTRAEQKLRNQRDDEIRKADEKYIPQLNRIRELRQRIIAERTERFEQQKHDIAESKRSDLSDLDESHAAAVEALDTDAREGRERLEQERADRLAELDDRLQHAQSQLEERWNSGMSESFSVIRSVRTLDTARFRPWDDDSWAVWSPPADFPPAVRFGAMEVDFEAMPGGVPRDQRLLERVPHTRFTVPAMIDFPWNTSMLFEVGKVSEPSMAETQGGDGPMGGRERAVATLQNVMMRLLTSFPPGKVRFTIIDPVGLGQNFAGFMHLADFEEAFVADRIWTETRHIEQRLADLTEHMENVIQKYLRNDFETITDYNIHAGEIAEPFRFLVIADFPVNFSETAAKRLVSIVESGRRCGVYTLISMDSRHQMPQGFQPDDLRRGCGARLVSGEGGLVTWDDRVFGRLPLSLDPPPTPEFMTGILRVIGSAARDATRVEVPFEHVVPPQEKYWTFRATRDLTVPLGRAGATKLQSLTLGRGMAQHALIAGKTGSGKSTLLHVLVTNLSLRFRPDEVEFYLVDFKKGVEFKTYATHNLPHARAVAIESDREFGLSVLQRVDAELKRRGELFRKLGVQDLQGYRELQDTRDKAIGNRDQAIEEGPVPSALSPVPCPVPSPQCPIPRTLLIIDEFQEFFVEDDRIAQEAALLLDRLVRQGRAFGIHILLGSQTLGGAYSLARATIGQMAVRIALQCSENDAMLIMGDDNTAPRLLSRPGEAIYNDSGGLVEGNSPFQVVWLPDRTREQYLEEIQRLVKKYGYEPPEPQIVFEGNAPADINRNQPLRRTLGSVRQNRSKSPRLWVGEAIAIKDPTAAVFRRQSGTNLLIVGQRDEAALAMHANGLIALAAQTPVDTARFYVFDGTPEDSPLAGRLEQVAQHLPHDVRLVTWHETEQAMVEIGTELQRRMDRNITDAAPVFIFIYAAQRFRQLRHREEFGFSMDDGDKPPTPDRHLAAVLRDGPPLGMHTILWCDNANNLSRTFDRNTLREFDQRVMFQMSATDSSSLIDTPIGSTLGENRGLYFSEDRGILEKFRPYAMPDPQFLRQAAEAWGQGA